MPFEESPRICSRVDFSLLDLGTGWRLPRVTASPEASGESSWRSWRPAACPPRHGGAGRFEGFPRTITPRCRPSATGVRPAARASRRGPGRPSRRRGPLPSPSGQGGQVAGRPGRSEAVRGRGWPRTGGPPPGEQQVGSSAPNMPGNLGQTLGSTSSSTSDEAKAWPTSYRCCWNWSRSASASPGGSPAKGGLPQQHAGRPSAPAGTGPPRSGRRPSSPGTSGWRAWTTPGPRPGPAGPRARQELANEQHVDQVKRRRRPPWPPSRGPEAAPSPGHQVRRRSPGPGDGVHPRLKTALTGPGLHQPGPPAAAQGHGDGLAGAGRCWPPPCPVQVQHLQGRPVGDASGDLGAVSTSRAATLGHTDRSQPPRFQQDDGDAGQQASRRTSTMNHRAAAAAPSRSSLPSARRRRPFQRPAGALSPLFSAPGLQRPARPSSGATPSSCRPVDRRPAPGDQLRASQASSPSPGGPAAGGQVAALQARWASCGRPSCGPASRPPRRPRSLEGAARRPPQDPGGRPSRRRRPVAAHRLPPRPGQPLLGRPSLGRPAGRGPAAAQPGGPSRRRCRRPRRLAGQAGGRRPAGPSAPPARQSRVRGGFGVAGAPARPTVRSGNSRLAGGTVPVPAPLPVEGLGARPGCPRGRRCRSGPP